MKRVGIIAAQGAVSEHKEALDRAMTKMKHEWEIIPVRSKKSLDMVDGVILPGGESTAISKLLVRFGLYSAIIRRVKNGMPIMGTCAGTILLAREAGKEVEKTGIKLLSLMDMEVNRNAFGRQRESFQTELEITGFSEPYDAVFIRAPSIERIWDECKPLARLDDKIVAAKQGSCFAFSFHPELTPDTRLHELFLSEIQNTAN